MKQPDVIDALTWQLFEKAAAIGEIPTIESLYEICPPEFKTTESSWRRPMWRMRSNRYVSDEWLYRDVKYRNEMIAVLAKAVSDPLDDLEINDAVGAFMLSNLLHEPPQIVMLRHQRS